MVSGVINMNASNMKNMVVLNNLPSNIIDEAIVVLKSNKKVKNLEKIENYKTVDSNSDKKREEEYILKEAEMLVNDYICKIEDNKKQEKKINMKRIKMWAYISTIIAVIECLIII